MPSIFGVLGSGNIARPLIAGLRASVAVPRRHDPTLSTRRVDALRRNVTEIEREVDAYQMRFSPVTAVAAAVGRGMEIACSAA